MQGLAEKLEPYSAGATAAEVDTGFTVVLIDNQDGSEGDFVYVESYEKLSDLIGDRQIDSKLRDAARGVIRGRAGRR